MTGCELPRQVEVGGVDYEIRTDYRAILDLCAVYGEPELSNGEKALAVLDIFYFAPEGRSIPPEHWREAIEKCVWFIDGGDQPLSRSPGPSLVNWEQDIRMILAPISRVNGGDVRAIPYDYDANQGGLHWWTFLSLYMEIGDCLFAQVVRIRDKKARGKRLDKQDQEFYRRNRELVDIRRTYTENEQAFLKEWGAG